MKQSQSDSIQSLRSLPVGSDRWWDMVNQIGTPLVTPENSSGESEYRESNSKVSMEFYWRDPEGDEHQSSTAAVYIDIPNLTDHHSFTPDALTRIKNTDVWHWSMSVENDWRGSYSFIPIKRQQSVPEPTNDEGLDKHNLRHWWRSLQPFAIADPLNQHSPYEIPWGGRYSSIHLNNAPYQYGWHQSDTQKVPHYQPSELDHFSWSSEQLKNQRDVWVFQPRTITSKKQSARKRPVVLILDGDYWANIMPIFNTLKMETAQQRIQPATFVLIDSINPKLRAEELGCNKSFWVALREELLPIIESRSLNVLDTQNITVTGQSFGGLAALYAGLEWPSQFNQIISQSGSFWWPHSELMKQPNLRGKTGWLIQEAKNRQHQKSIKIYLEVGTKEKALSSLNQKMKEVLTTAGHQVIYHQYNGGHDRLCWRGGLLKGLHQHLKPKTSKHYTVSKEKVTNDGKRLYQSV